MSAKRRRNSRNNTGAKYVVFIVIVFLIVMSVQIYKLKEKNAMLVERETLLQKQLEEEIERSESLVELDLYTRSMDYIKDMANKMGLVFENEIIFKESSE